MTNLTDHVVGLDIAKELKAAGYPQDSLFYWIDNSRLGAKHKKYITVSGKGVLTGKEADLFAAPLASEIGKQLLGNIDEFVRDNLDDLDTDLNFDWQNDDHPYYNADLLAKVWLLLRRNGP